MVIYAAYQSVIGYDPSFLTVAVPIHFTLLLPVYLIELDRSFVEFMDTVLISPTACYNYITQHSI